MGALFSFLGGSAFRLIFGEVSAYITKAQDHKYELARLEFQEKVDMQAHDRNMAAMQLQHTMGKEIIHAQAEADLSRIDAGAWAEAVSSIGRSTGIKFLDAWNGSIRPLLATMAVIMLGIEFASNDWILSAALSEVIYAVIGIYIADRQLGKRGK